MTLFFMDNPGITGIYNVGTGQARTWNDYVRAIFTALDSTPEIEYVEMPAAIAGQYQYYTQANMERLGHAGYAKAPQRLEDSVWDYVQNYLAQGSFLSGHG